MSMKKILITLSLFFILIGTVYAQGFKQLSGRTDNLYDNLNSSIGASKDQYPFNLTNQDATIQNVGFDLLFGVGKGLVKYTGEVPYLNTRNKKGVAFIGMDKFPTWSGSAEITDTSYWGNFAFKTTTDGDPMGKVGISKEQLEEVQGTDSLRLYALRVTAAGGIDIGAFLYGIMQMFVMLTMSLMNVIFRIKTLDMTAIVDMFKLDGLVTFIQDLFLFHKDANGNISPAPLMLVALICLIISLAKFGYEYAAGRKKGKGLTEIALVAFVGFILLGMANGGSINILGSKIADITNNVLISVNPTTSDTGIFVTTVTNGDTAQDAYQSQISAINKVYIDAQITTQFGVYSIDDLDLDKFTTNVDIKNKLGDTTKFGNNLGYYFWYANSGAKELKTDAFPTLDTNQHEKMSKLFTFLQESLNEAKKENPVNTDKIAKIGKITQSLAAPDTAWGFLKLILLNLVLIGLSFVIIGYALFSLIGKLYLIIGLLAIPVAGALIISTNRKMVDTGKSLLGLFVVGFLYVTFYSMVFDLIIFVTSITLVNDILSMFITGALLGIIYKFRKSIQAFISGLLKGVEKAYAPELSGWKANIRSLADRRASKKVENKVEIGRDADDNPIYGKSILTSTKEGVKDVVRDLTNSRTVDYRKIGNVFGGIKEDIKGNQTKLSNAETSRVKRSVDEAEYELQRDISYRTLEAYDTAENGDRIYRKLTASEGQLEERIQSKETTLSLMKNNQEMSALASKENRTQEEETKLKAHTNMVDNYSKEIREMKQELNQKVDTRIKNRAIEDNKETLSQSYDDAIKNQERLMKEKERKKEKITREDISKLAELHKKKDAIENGENSLEVQLSREDKEIIREASEKKITKKKEKEKSTENVLSELKETWKAKREPKEEETVEESSTEVQEEAKPIVLNFKKTETREEVIHDEENQGDDGN